MLPFCADIFAPKNYKAKCNYRKAAQFVFVQKISSKMLIKLTPERICEGIKNVWKAFTLYVLIDGSLGLGNRSHFVAF